MVGRLHCLKAYTWQKSMVEESSSPNGSQEGERQEGTRGKDTLQRHVPSDLLPVVRSNLPVAHSALMELMPYNPFASQ